MNRVVDGHNKVWSHYKDVVQSLRLHDQSVKTLIPLRCNNTLCNIIPEGDAEVDVTEYAHEILC